MGEAGSHPLKPYVDLSLETSNARKLKVSEYLLCYMETEICKFGLDPLFKYGRVTGSQNLLQHQTIQRLMSFRAHGSIFI